MARKKTCANVTTAIKCRCSNVLRSNTVHSHGVSVAVLALLATGDLTMAAKKKAKKKKAKKKA